jgi:hypothetical protein
LTREVGCESFNIQQAAVEATEKRGGTRKRRAPKGRALYEKSMSLASEAQELIESLKLVVAGLEAYDKDSRSDYTMKMAARLKPLVESFDRIVTVDKSKELAKQQFDEIRELMHNAMGAYTKGDVYFVEDSVLDKYWQHHTIFQESKYAHESL